MIGRLAVTGRCIVVGFVLGWRLPVQAVHEPVVLYQDDSAAGTPDGTRRASTAAGRGQRCASGARRGVTVVLAQVRARSAREAAPAAAWLSRGVILTAAKI